MQRPRRHFDGAVIGADKYCLSTVLKRVNFSLNPIPRAIVDNSHAAFLKCVKSGLVGIGIVACHDPILGTRVTRDGRLKAAHRTLRHALFCRRVLRQ